MHKVTWEDRYHVWMAYCGVTLLSMVAWGIGAHFLGTFWSTFCILIPPTAFTLMVR